MKIKRCLCAILTVSLLTGPVGCGNSTSKETTSNEEITLIDPVNGAVTSEAVQYRNIYNATIYSSYVFPETKEYSFAKDAIFDHYGTYPGLSVSNGSPLIVTNTESIDKEIKKVNETIKSMQDSFDSYVLSVDDQIAEKEFYSGQKADALGADAQNNIDLQLMCADIWTLRLQKEQRQELLELDLAYYNGYIDSLNKEKTNNSLSSTMNGTIVAIAPYKQGGKVTRDIPIVAVGDLNTLVLKSDYINRGTISQAQDVYAIIDGVRYEIAYQAIDSDEYSRLTAKGETVVSTFSFTSDTTNVNVGDYAALVVQNESREQCLSVPNSSIHKDETGNYVYVVENGESTYRLIHTGITDGVYTEVLDGVSFGEQVLIDTINEHKNETAKISRGDFSTSFESVGEAYYPSETPVRNEIEYGTVYFLEYEAPLYSHVNKGDVIAKITVSQDTVALERKSTELTRLKERAQDLEDEWQELCKKSYETSQDDIIAQHEIHHDMDMNRQSLDAMNKQITELTEELGDIYRAYNTTSIVATKSGIITQELVLKEQDIINTDEVIAVIADEDACFIKVDNTNQLLNYGNDITITYSDQDRNSHSIDGSVVSLSNLGTSNGLDSETILVQIPSDAVSDITAALILPPGYEDDYNESWFNDWRKIFKIKGEVRKMEQVLTVPKNAVYVINNKTYVYVKNPDGSIVFTSFIAGGYDSSNYWIIDGLEEGSEVCLK